MKYFVFVGSARVSHYKTNEIIVCFILWAHPLTKPMKFHENDLIVLGSNDSDMTIASNHLIKNQGGLVVVKSGKILASLPLQFAGIVSTDSFETVSSNFEQINNSIVDLGCKFTKPHLIPLFLPFLALPSVRILAGGIVDVKKRSYISPIN